MAQALLRRIPLVLAASALIAAGVLALHSDVHPPELDEMMLLGSGARIVHGDVPYRDLRTYLGPGTLALQALVVGATGTSLLGARALALIAWIAAWCFVARRVPASAFACVGGAGFFLWWPVTYHHWWGAIALLAWCCAELAVQRSPDSRAASIAWCATLVLVPLVEQTTGFVALLAALACAVPRLRTRAEWMRIAAAAMLAGLVVLVLAAAGLLGPMLHDTVAWPLTSYRSAGGVNESATLAADVASRAHRTHGTVALFGAAALLVTWPLALGCVLVPRATPSPSLRLARALVVLLPVAFVLGRHDLVHAAFLLPIALAAIAIAGAPGGTALTMRRLTIASALVSSLGAIAALDWTLPTLTAWRDMDDSWRHDGLVEIAHDLAARNGGDLAVLGFGSRFTYYGVATPLNVLDAHPRGSIYWPQADADAIAAILASRRPQWIALYPASEAPGFLAGDDALGRLLRERYPTRKEASGFIAVSREP